MKHLKLFENFNKVTISENVKYHLDNKINFTKNIFRTGSESFYNLLEEVRNLYDDGQLNLNEIDEELYESTDIGRFGVYEGKKVPLDIPMLDEESLNESEYKGKKVKLNKPMRSSGPKKYKVYVKDPKTGNVKVVNFGDMKGGLTAKVNDPEARKSFVARHKCDRKWKPEDKLKPSYWSCRLPKFKNLVSTDFSGYW